MNMFGFAQIAVCSPVLTVARTGKNLEAIFSMVKKANSSDIIVFPELAICGYTCGDLFKSSHLLVKCLEELRELATATHQAKICSLIIVGAPIVVGNQLFNCGVVIQGGKILGIVPKQNIPNYNEFYESRWFSAANGQEPKFVEINNEPIPFGIDLLFATSNSSHKLIVGVEVCEDLWVPVPPSSIQCLAGANVLVNLSASNETVAKHEYRRSLVEQQSGRCLAAYAYASAGPSESTSDLVFGGHCMIAENGHIVAESSRIGQPENPLDLGERLIVYDVDIEKLQNDRRSQTSFRDASNNKNYRYIPFKDNVSRPTSWLSRNVSGTPFVPSDESKLKNRCSEIFGIQCAGLAGRIKQLIRDDVSTDVYIGVSGGLDSTLALLVAVKTYKSLGLSLKKIHGITMPGFGTTNLTKSNATKLMSLLGISSHEIDIRQNCIELFKILGIKPFNIVIDDSTTVESFQEKLNQLTEEQRLVGDLSFENIQARSRTLVLMSQGFVLGTGGLSELALGWCTYNGDHMSMYNVNCSIPKTLVKFMVKYVAEALCEEWSNDPELKNCLMSIYGTTISPELLPSSVNGEITQSTEDIIGPYELHDFFLMNMVRNGFSPKKILYLAGHANFSKPYDNDTILNTLRIFIKRFFSQQFKRNCVPDGPKVGSVSLSPRGDWRMPSDASPKEWM